MNNGGRPKTKFQAVNFPFLSSNIPESPVYGVYISQLVSHSRVCAQHIDFLDRAQLLKHYYSNKLRCS